MSLSQSKKIVLDTDGVILDFDKAFFEVLRETLDREPLLAAPLSYDLAERYALSSQEHDHAWKHFADSGRWSRLEAYEKAPEAVSRLVDSGYEIHVVTGIPELHMQDRLDNFAKFGFKPASIICVGHGKASKTSSINTIDPFMFVDDRLDHLHRSPDVPLLVWIENPVVQYPISGIQHHATAPTLHNWVDEFLSDPKAFLQNHSHPQPARSSFKAR